MPDLLINLVALLVLIVPLAAIQWNLAGRRSPSRLGFGPSQRDRWRLEIYSNADGIGQAVVDPADIPFPVKLVRSARGELAQTAPVASWSLPQIELEVAVDQPFADDVLDGVFGGKQRLRFVTGSEASLDIEDARVRIRALPLDPE
jgi:hypothetical protein